MVSKHCLSCGTEGHPRTRHPSSLKTEVTVWLLAVAVGTAAGLWSAVTSASDAPLSRTVQAMALSSTQSAEQAAPAVTEGRETGGGSQVLGWLLDTLLAFLRVAWWVLPIPIAFSLWRQTRTYPVCRACGSRDLEELITPHGALPPAI